MKRKKMFIAVLALVIAAVFTSCAFNPELMEKLNPGTAFFYGYVGFDTNGAVLNSMLVKKLDPGEEKPFYWCGIYRGVFFCYLPQGNYRVEKFTSIESCGYNCTTTINYNMPAQDNGFVIKNTGLYFLTSIRIKNKPTGGFFSDTVESTPEKADWPSEEQILERLMDISQKGSNLQKMIYSRLMQYRKLRGTNAKTAHP
jgi:hypothetical protein